MDVNQKGLRRRELKSAAPSTETGDHNNLRQYWALLERLHNLKTASKSINQAKRVSLAETEKDAFADTVKLYVDSLQDALQDIASKLYTTVLIVGQSGSGKTHILNQLINRGLNLSDETFVLTEAQVRNCLLVTVSKRSSDDGPWTPANSAANRPVCLSSSNRNHFCPNIQTLETVKKFDILPEGDMMCTTRVPIHIFHGSKVKITFGYAGVTEVHFQLKRLLEKIQTLSLQVKAEIPQL